MSSELEEMAENIRVGEQILIAEEQYLKEHPKDYVGLAHLVFSLKPGHHHEITNVLADNKYFCDPVLLEYAVRLGAGKLVRSMG